MTQDSSYSPASGPKVNPIKAIWSQPRQAVRAALAYYGDNGVHRLSMAVGIGLILVANLDRWLKYGAHPVELLLMFLLIGPIMGIIGTYILAAVVRAVGGWFGGKAPKPEMLTAMAWSHLPMATALLAYALISFALYRIAPPVWNAGPSGYMIGSIVAGVLLGAYFSYVRILAIAEIHLISVAKAAATYFISIILILTPLIFFGFIYLILFFKSLSAPSIQ